MYGNFEGWLQTNGYPWETYEESKERYRSLYGEDDDIKIAETPTYTYEPEPVQEEEEGFLDSFLGGSEYLPSLSEFGSAAAKSWDETQASGATIAETMVAPALDWIGSFKEGEQRAEKYADDIREWAPGYREEQLAEAAQYPEIQNRLQKRLAEDPNYTPAETREQTLARLQAEGSEWYNIAKHVPEWIPLTLDKAIEDAPTAGEVGSFATGSAVPMVGAAAVGLPLAVAGAPITAAVGAMGTGALMSSLLVSSETAENIKNNPVVRRALEVDDQTAFEDLPAVTQQKIMKVAEDGAQSNLGQRLISSGIPEMLGYIPAGGWLLRSLTDIAGGTTSEVWDISVSREAMVSALLENGVDPNKASELDMALEAIGPKKSEVFMKALVGEAVATGPITAAEEIVRSQFKPRDHRVNVQDTETKELKTQAEEEEKQHIKIRTNQIKSLSDAKAKRQNQVDDLVDLWQVDPDRATQELEDFKLNEGRTQNDIQDILSVEHPEVLRDIVTRIGDEKRRKELEDALEKADKEAQKRAEAEEKTIQKEAKALKKEEDKKNEVVDAKKAIKEYEAEKPDLIRALAKKTITQEQFDEWDQASRPIRAYEIAKKYDDSVKAEEEAKVKKDEEAKAKAKPKVEAKAKVKTKAKVKVKDEVKVKPVETKKTKEDLKLAEAKRKETKQDDDVIVLGNKFRTIEDDGAETNTDLSNALDKINNLGKRNPLNEKEIIIGETAVEVIVNTLEDNALEVKSIRSWDKGKGNATKTLKKILDIAKEEKIDLVGTAKAIGKEGATTPQLKKWYKKLGYEDHTKGQIIFRGDKVAPAPVETTTPEVETSGDINELAGRYERVRVNNQPGKESKKTYKFSREESEIIGKPGSDKWLKFEGARKKYRETNQEFIQVNLDRLSKFIAKNPQDKDSLTGMDLDFIEKNQKEFDSRLAELNKPVKEEVKSKYKVPNLEPILKKGDHEGVIENAGGSGGNPATDKVEGGAKVPLEFLYPKRKQRVEDIKGDYDEGMMNYEDYRDDLETIIWDDINDGKYAEDADISDIWDKDNMDSVSQERFAKALVRQQKAQKKAEKKDVKKSVVPEDSVLKILEGATGPESIYNLKKDEAKNLIDSFVSNTKLKDKDVDIRVFSKEDDADIKALNELMGEEQATEVLETSEGFVAGGKTIGIIAENIRGRVASARLIAGGKSAAGRLVNTLFHEIIGHYGLKKLLGDKYKTFINRFIKSNKKTLEEYAMGKSGMDYLPESVREIKSLESRRSAYNALTNKSDVEFIIAEEYIARNFAEFGARDPNIINRIVASLRDYISSIPMFEDMGITTNQVKKIMTELQQEYIGGKRNFKTFIFGEDFRTLPDTQLDTTEEEEVKAEGAPEVEVDDGIEVLTLDDKKATTDKAVNMSKRTKPDPEKTIKAYKLFQTKKKQPGKLFPLFLGATESVPIGEWQDADIKSKKGFAPRPGWHLSDLPFALHIGTFMNKFSKPTVRPDNQVWAEVEVSADVDWQPEANKRAKKYSKSHKMAGQINPKTADIKNEVPVDGNYRYKTNPNMKGEWIIAGSIKVNRILSDSEVKSINDKAGVADLPRKGQKVNMSKKDSAFDKVLQRAEEKAKLRPQGTSEPEKAGVAYRVKISDEAVKKYLDSKSEEAPSMVGVMRLPNMSKMPKELASELQGELAVGMVADRLIRGKYKPIHKRSKIDIFLNGGPMYAFDEKRNKGKLGRAVWASEATGISKIYNTVMSENGPKYGFILVGKDDMHMSNAEVWRVAYEEAMDAIKFGDSNMALFDEGAIKAVESYAPEFVGEITTFKQLMELGLKNELTSGGKKGKEIAFQKRKEMMIMMFGDTRAKKNGNHFTYNDLKNRTSEFPNSDSSDLIGIVRFDKDNKNFRTNAKKLGIEEHPSYKDILLGEGIFKFDKPVKLEGYAKKWLLQKRRTYDKKTGELTAINPPFWRKGQTDFGQGRRFDKEANLNSIIAEENLIYSPEVISWITGKPITSGPLKIDYLAKKKIYDKALRDKKKELISDEKNSELDIKEKLKEWKTKNKPPVEPIIKTKPPRGKRYKVRPTEKSARAAVGRSIDLSAPKFTIDNIITPLPTGKITVNMSKRAEMQSYKAAESAIGRLSDEGLYWMPTFKAQDKLAHKLTKRLIAQGTLPDMELYRDIRRKNKGVVFQAQQAGEKLFKILRKSKQQKALYNYFVTPNADSSLITNPKEREAAVSAKKQIMQIGRDLVERGLMTQASLDKFDDQYLPRKYLKYLLRDKDYRAIDQGGAGVNVDLGYTAKRKDIPEGIRELILGEVKDPAFLSSIAISTPVRDMAILDMFEQIASNPNWVLPKTLVKFDIVGELKRLSNNDTELIKSLQLHDTGGNVKISGHWLMNEAERIRDLVDDHMILDNKREALVRKLIKLMNDKGREIVGQIIPSEYKRIPKGRKYGRLQGMAVRKEIFEDLFGWGTNSSSFDVNADGTIDASWAEKVLGTGGTFEQYNRLWKWSKVSANPPSWVRNFVSNLIFMNLGPVPLGRMPDLFLRSLTDQIKTRKVEKFGTQKEFDELKTYTKIADEMGLTSGGFSQAELKTIRNQFVSSKVKNAGPLSLIAIRDAFKGLQRTTSDVYGGIDTLGKVMMVKYLMESKGATKEVAAGQAEKYLFDYSNPLPSVKYLRKSAFGAPFLSYPSFVAPVLIETLIKRPWKFAPYIGMGYLIKNMFKEEQGVSDDEYEAVMGTLSDYLRKRANQKADFSLVPESVLPLPHKDSLGRAQVVDLGYFFPWGMFTEVFRQLNPFTEDGSQITGAMHSVGLMGSPLLNIAVTATTGRDPFTDRQIHDEFATGGEKYASWFNYAFNLTLPPMFHGLSPVGSTGGFFGKGIMKNPDAGGFGALKRLNEAYSNVVGREGEPKFTEAQAWLRMVGLNITPLAPFEARAKQSRFEVQKIKGLQRAIKMKYMKGLQANYSKKQLNKLLKNDVERVNRQIEKLKKRLSKKLPASLKRSKKDLLKSREAYLRYLKTLKAS